MIVVAWNQRTLSVRTDFSEELGNRSTFEDSQVRVELIRLFFIHSVKDSMQEIL